MTSQELKERFDAGMVQDALKSGLVSKLVWDIIADLEAAEKERDEWKDSYTSEFYHAESAEALLREAREVTVELRARILEALAHSEHTETYHTQDLHNQVDRASALLSRIEEVVG